MGNRISSAGRISSTRNSSSSGRISSTRIWTPGNLGDYWLRPSLATSGPDSSLTLSGSAISSASVGGSKTLSQATTSKKPGYDTSSLLNGYAMYTTNNSAATVLSSSSGGIINSAPHAIWGVFSHPSSPSYNGLLTFGPTASGSTLGTNNQNHWGGGPGFVNPIYTPGDTGSHLFLVNYDGVNKSLYVDGELLLASYTAVSAYNIGDSSFGIQPAFDGAVATANIRTAGWLRHQLTPEPNGDIRKLEMWAASIFGLTKNRLLLCLGDSQTSGFSATVSPLNWPSRIATQGPLTKTYDIEYAGGTPYVPLAVAGWQTTDIITNYVSGTINRFSGFRPRVVAVLWAGTNDLYFGSRTPAATYANLSMMILGMRAAGIYVIIVTPLPREDSGVPAGYEANRQILRSAILANSANADAINDIGGLASLQTPSSTTNYQADKVHLNVNAINNIVCPELANSINNA